MSMDKHLGLISQKLARVRVTVRYAKGYKGLYGTRYFHAATDAFGRRVTWFQKTQLVIGQTYLISGTVKDRCSAVGTDEATTRLFRVKLLDEEIQVGFDVG